MRRSHVSTAFLVGGVLLVASASAAFGQVGDPGVGGRGESVTTTGASAVVVSTTTSTVSSTEGTSSPVVSDRFGFSRVARQVGWGTWDVQHFLPAEGMLSTNRTFQMFLRRWLGM
jgi:hypothetical protein